MSDLQYTNADHREKSEEILRTLRPYLRFQQSALEFSEAMVGTPYASSAVTAFSKDDVQSTQAAVALHQRMIDFLDYADESGIVDPRVAGPAATSPELLPEPEPEVEPEEFDITELLKGLYGDKEPE